MFKFILKTFGGVKKQTKEFKKQFSKQLLKLVTSGFGLVAALAWNELIKEIVAGYIKPAVGGASGVVSLFVYAVLITFLAVLVTYNLSRVVKKN